MSKIAPPPPLRILILEDMSGSRETARLEVVELAAMDSLARYVLHYGGVIATGVINDQPNQLFERLYLERQAAPRLDTTGNPILDRQNRKQYDEALEAGQSYLQQIADELNRLLDAFRGWVKQGRLSQETDVASALNLANLFMCEPHLGQEPVKYLVIHSDMDDTMGKEFYGFDCPFDVFVVGPSRGAPLLDAKGIPYDRFLSLPAALRHLRYHHQYTP